MIPISDADVRRRSFPIVNVLLIGANTLVFLYELQLGGLGLLAGGGSREATIFFLKWGFIPEELAGGKAFSYLQVGRFSSISIDSPVPTWATIFSSMFIHGGLLHFVGNMLFLWVFGDNVEDRLGHLKYLGFYLLAGVVAALSQLAVDPHSETPLVGASGAVSGVMGSYLLLYPYNRINTLIIFYLITVVRLPAILMLGFWILLQVLNGLGSLGISEAVNVAFFAHIGGFIAGLAGTALYHLLTGQPIWPRRRRSSEEHWHRSGQ